MKNIGTTLKALRVERGYTLRQLAEKAQMPFSHLSNIENGKRMPGLDIIDRICFALGVRVRDVIIKTELEKELKADRQKLYRDLQPYFRKIDSLAKQIYGPDDDRSDEGDGGINEQGLTPIIQGGGTQEANS